MNHTIREQQALKGIGQHKLDMRDPLRVDDVVGIVCLVGFIAWLIWLCYILAEGM